MANDFERDVSRDIGALQADMRTVKHDVANMSGKIDGLHAMMAKVTNQQARGLGFFAGMAFILTAAGGALIAMARAIFGAGG